MLGAAGWAYKLRHPSRPPMPTGSSSAQSAATATTTATDAAAAARSMEAIAAIRAKAAAGMQGGVASDHQRSLVITLRWLQHLATKQVSRVPQAMAQQLALLALLALLCLTCLRSRAQVPLAPRMTVLLQQRARRRCSPAGGGSSRRRQGQIQQQPQACCCSSRQQPAVHTCLALCIHLRPQHSSRADLQAAGPVRGATRRPHTACWRTAAAGWG